MMPYAIMLGTKRGARKSKKRKTAAGAMFLLDYQVSSMGLAEEIIWILP
jgi:hypothetical protein